MPIVSLEVKGKMKTPEIDPSCWISESAWIIGDVKLGPGNTVYQGVIIRGDFARIRIGANNVFQDACIINTAGGFPTKIGDNNLIGFNALVHGATVKNNSVVGIGSILMTGVKVMDNSMVGATSFVKMNTTVPEGKKFIGRELKGDNTQGKMWEFGRQSWQKNGMVLKDQKEKC